MWPSRTGEDPMTGGRERAGEVRRGGFVLVVTVVILVTLALLVHGALVLARMERLAAGTVVALLQAEGQARLAESAIHGLNVSALPAPSIAGDASSEARLLRISSSAGTRTLVARPLDREWWWMEARGTSPDGRVTVRRQGTGWRWDPATRVAASRGVVEVGRGAGVVGGDRISASGSLRPLPGPGGPACRTQLARLDSLGMATPLRWRQVEMPASGPGLGLLSQEALRGIIPTLSEGWGRPTPVEDESGCRPGPWNWGDPGGQEVESCRERWVARSASGNLGVEGGGGQGLLWVAGDLHLSRGAQLRGLVLAGGTVRLSGGAKLVGLVRAAGGVALEDSARVEGSACAAVLALDALREEAGAARFVLPSSFWEW